MEIILTSHKIAMGIEQVGAWHREVWVWPGMAHHTWKKIASDLCRGCSDNLLSPLNGREQPSVLTQLYPGMNSHFRLDFLEPDLQRRIHPYRHDVQEACSGKLAQDKAGVTWRNVLPTGCDTCFCHCYAVMKRHHDQHFTGSLLTASEGYS